MLVTLDFESYYDKDYTLFKMSTSEYVRDDRFEVLTCSIKKDDLTPFCYVGRDAIELALSKIDWKNATMLAHHTHFDGLIASHHFGVVPARYADTLSMARGLRPKFESNKLEFVAVAYAKQHKLVPPEFKGLHIDQILANKKLRDEMIAYNNADTQSCYEVYQEMLRRGYPTTELDLIDLTVRMFADPKLVVDMDLAKDELKAEQDRRAKAIEGAGVDIKALASNKTFPALLEQLGVDVPTKPSPSVKDKRIPAIAKSDDALQNLRLHHDPKVVALVEGRLAAKSTIGETRAARMLARGAKGMRLPIYLNYFGAHTGRWSGGDKFNPQNFKQAKKVGGRLREAIMAPPGYHVVVVDAAQIEARIVAWLASEEWVLEAFRQKRDIYCEFASQAYGRTITKADDQERFVGKTCVLGLGFGMGGPKLQFTLLTQSVSQGLDAVRLPIDVCFHLVNTYRNMCANIVAEWKFLNDQGIGAMLSGSRLEHQGIAFEKGRIVLPNGMALLYPGLTANISQSKGGRFFKGVAQETVHDASYLGSRARNKIYGGLLAENIVQALARIVVADVMREIARSYPIVMMTHDEIVFLAPESEAQAALDEAIKLMAIPPNWAPNLPLSSEGKHDERYKK